MKIALIDNYDSFTHILAQYLKEQDGVSLTILKNDAFCLEELIEYNGLVISPGPGLPEQAGMIKDVIRKYSGQLPILGVCLGLQAIYEVFGGSLFNLSTVQHGVTSKVSITDAEDPILKNINSPFDAGRYHSWVCDSDTLPNDLVITARDENGTIMACRHRNHPTYGVQFHPESILTPEGKRMIRNFCELL